MKEESGLLAEGIEIIEKTALSAIPIGVTLISCVWDSIKANAAKKRLGEWKEMIDNMMLGAKHRVSTNPFFKVL